jgi:hypothetical protein
MVGQPPSVPADTGFRAGRRLPGMPWVIAGALVVAFLVLLYGTFRLGWTWTGFQKKDDKEDNATVWGWLKLVLLPVTIALLPLWLRSRGRRKAHWRAAFAVLGLVLAVLVVGGYRLHWAWTGFADNTLWDWLGLFLVPFVLPAVVAWATTPPPAPRLEERVAPERAAPRHPASAGPVAEVLPAPLVQPAAPGPHARGVVDPVELDATDPGIRLAARHLPASLPSQAHSGSGAAGKGPLGDAPPAQPPTDQPRRATGTESPDPPAQPPPIDPEPAVLAVAPARGAPTRLVRAHPGMAIAATVVGIALVGIGMLLGLQAQPPLARATGSSTPTTAAPGGIVRTVRVSSRTQWTDTGIHLTKGQRVTITASGRVDHNRGSTDPLVGPDGDGNPAFRRFSILRSAPHAALLGMIAGTEGHPFLVGSHYTDAVGQSGLLLLCVNDAGRTDNAGAFTAQIDVAMP